jgi:hypothetical protein
MNKKRALKFKKVSRQGMTEEVVHHKGAGSQFWCIRLIIMVRFYN